MTTEFPEAAQEVPLDEAGELQLPAELQQLADALRGEAARLAERAVPQEPAARLLGALAARRVAPATGRRGPRGGRTARRLAVRLAVVGAAVWAGWLAGQAGVPRGSGSGDLAGAPAVSSAPVPAGAARGRAARGSGPGELWAERSPEGRAAERPDVFLSAEQEGPTGWMLPDDAWLGGSARLAGQPGTDEERLAVLERALERYRSVIGFQQERIRQDQAQLEEARAEIARLQGGLREPSGRPRGWGGQGTEGPRREE